LKVLLVPDPGGRRVICLFMGCLVECEFGANGIEALNLSPLIKIFFLDRPDLKV
jgi:hypothetical protein